MSGRVRSARPVVVRALLAAVLVAWIALAGAASALALEERLLLHDPDIHGDRIVFAHGGDLWTVASTGGTASRLTSHPGREREPRISPDGRTVAFTAEHDGTADVYTIPLAGGEPTRRTWHPGEDRVAAWMPDGNSLLVRSTRASILPRLERFFRVPLAGGLEEPLALASAGRASVSPDGRRLAFVAPALDGRTWKRYRGGGAPDVWIASLDGSSSERLTDWHGSDDSPQWGAEGVYYLSDRGGETVNLWLSDLAARTHRQVTRFSEHDVRSLGLGPGALVLEQGGALYRLDGKGETPLRLRISVPDDRPSARPAIRNVASGISSFDLSPRARRVALEARGEVFTVPAEEGPVRDLTRTPGAREREPTWSPDGRWIAWLSDATGEYEIHVAASDGSSPARQVTRAGRGWRSGLVWSPDGQRIAFADAERTLWWCDVPTGALHRVDTAPSGDIRDYAWSPDSRTLAYAKPGSSGLSALHLHALGSGVSTRVSETLADDRSPAFDPDGRWLWFVSRRAFVPDLGPFDLRVEASARDVIAAMTLRREADPPLAPRSDEEPGPETAAAEPESDGPAGDGSVRIDLDGIAGRVSILPVAPGRYSGLRAFRGRLLFARLDDPDPERDPASAGIASLLSFDLDDGEALAVVSGVAPVYAASADGAKVLYRAGPVFGILSTRERGRVGSGRVPAGELPARVDPAAEWRQIFHEAWRLERDFFYDPEMGGLDWEAVRDRYARLLPDVADRADLNRLLGEMLGELATSHAYVEGGDLPRIPEPAVGLLGADFDVDPASGRYRFARIYAERDASPGLAPPLGGGGRTIREGDVLIAVEGRDVRPPENVYAAFAGTAGQPTRLRVASTPGAPGGDGAGADLVSRARTVVVVPVADESPLRYASWVARNRERVEAATAGRAAYVHLPDTAVRGTRELVRQLYAQLDREALIVDVRFNAGGFPPEFLIERIAATARLRGASRSGGGQRLPADGLDGPRCMLANGYSVSGGDALPLLFRRASLGPVIGTRTWGSFVANTHRLTLLDGGVITVPELGLWSRERGFEVENRGVEPDVEVESPPHEGAGDRDPQLEAAIAWCRERLAAQDAAPKRRPDYPSR